MLALTIGPRLLSLKTTTKDISEIFTISEHFKNIGNWIRSKKSFERHFLFASESEQRGISDTRACIGNLIYDGKFNFFGADALNACEEKSKS